MSQLYFTLIVVPVVLLAFYIFGRLNKKRHKTILSSKLFKAFIQKGFTTEIAGNYHGLIGAIDGYTIRIYYDGSSASSNSLVFLAYYQPLFVDSNPEKLDEEKLKYLNKDFEFKWSDLLLSSDNSEFTLYTPCFLARDSKYSWHTPQSDAFTDLNEVIEMVKQEGLQPITIEQIKLWEKDTDLFGPFIETYSSKVTRL